LFWNSRERERERVGLLLPLDNNARAGFETLGERCRANGV